MTEINEIEFWNIETELGQIAESYIKTVLQAERYQACKRIMECVDKGISIKDIYLGVLQPVQLKIGWLWQNNKITVGQEHFCSATTQLVMAQLYKHIASSEKTDKGIIAACVPGELHEIGVRMVADFFEMEGWRSYYLGASTPIDSIIDMIEDKEIPLLAISATITFNLSSAMELVKTIKSSDIGAKTKIMIGGRLFNVAKDLWQQVGVDGYAEDAQNAIFTAKTLIA